MTSIQCILHVYGGGDHSNGRLGLRVAVWQHRSKSVTAGLGVATYRLNASPVCDESATEGSVYTQIRRYISESYLP